MGSGRLKCRERLANASRESDSHRGIPFWYDVLLDTPNILSGARPPWMGRC
jgi:hypothetical protein